MTTREVDTLSEEGAKEALRSMITVLDTLDEEDYFGTPGWRAFFDDIIPHTGD